MRAYRFLPLFLLLALLPATVFAHPHVEATASTTGTIQTIPSGPYYSPVALNQTLDEHMEGMHYPNDPIDNSKLFVPSPGSYSFDAVVELDTASMGIVDYRYGIKVEKTIVVGSSQITETVVSSTSSVPTSIRRLSVHATVHFYDDLNYSKDNYLELKVFQESGHDIPLKLDDITPRFSMRRAF